MKFRKKPVIVEAIVWRRNGDHPDDACVPVQPSEGDKELFMSEGKLVRYYRHPGVPGSSRCISSIPCGYSMHVHGWIDTPEGGHNVCPGDWIVTGIDGERYPVKDRIFRQTYEKVEEE